MTSVTRPGGRQRKARDERREDVLAAATALFAERGIEATKMVDIAAAAGIAKGTVYLYFATKEELLAALKRRFVQELADETTAFASRVGQGDWWALVDAYVESMIDVLLAKRQLIQVMARDATTHEAISLFEESEHPITDVIANGIRAGVEAGVFTVDDPDTTSVLLQHAVASAVEHLIIYDAPIDRDRIVAAAKTLVRRALGGPDR